MVIVVHIWPIGCLGGKGLDRGTQVIFVFHSLVNRGGFWFNPFYERNLNRYRYVKASNI